MANRAFLVGGDDAPPAGPSTAGLSYNPDTEILAAASGLIPILWITLFTEADLVVHDCDGHPITMLATATVDAQSRISARRTAIKGLLPQNVGQVEAFSELIHSVPYDFVKVDTTEVWALSPETFEHQLTRAVSWATSRDSTDLEYLLDVAQLGGYEIVLPLGRTPKHNLHGYGWVRDVPWDDEDEGGDVDTVDVKPVEFGNLAVRGVEKHPFVGSLAALDFFSSAGTKPALSWALSRGRDLTDAYLTYAHDPGWGIVKITAWDSVLDWVEEKLEVDGDTYYREQRDDIDTACLAIFEQAIAPRLSSKLKAYNIGFDLYFGWDLMHMTLEHELVSLGKPHGLCSLLLQAYQAGHFPCGWEGDFPEGKLIVY